MTASPKGVKPGRMGKDRFEDLDHLGMIRELPCCFCLKHGPSEAHHLRRVEGTGMNRKAGDHQTIPLCSKHHRTGKQCAHSMNETEFLAKHSIDGPALAAALFSLTGDTERALALIGREK